MNKKKFFLITLFLVSLSTFFLFSQEKDKFIIVLDPGHGGKDPGNVNEGFVEKEIVLSVALKTGKYLSELDYISVIYTRDSDNFVELNKRAAVANNFKANLFLSFHCDSHSSEAMGFGTFVLGLHENKRNLNIAKKENAVILLEDNYQNNYLGYDPEKPESFIGISTLQEEFLDQSLEIAAMIQKSVSKKVKRKNRSVKQAGFLVLRNTFSPSVLIEIGFLTNKNEGGFLDSENGQNKIARAIADAVIDYTENLIANKMFIINSEKVVNQNTSNEKNNVYEIQIAASKNLLDSKPYNFNGLQNVNRENRNGLYIYYLTVDGNKEEADRMLSNVKNAGFKSAFFRSMKKNVTTQKKDLEIIFKVQIAAGKNKKGSKDFNNLYKFDVIKNNGLYKYFGAISKNYETILTQLKSLRKKGYPNAFVKAFIGNNSIPVSEALKKIRAIKK